jgi:hypothetical protein
MGAAMRRTTWIAGSLTAVLLAGCGGGRDDGRNRTETGAVGGTGGAAMDTVGMQSGGMHDTSMRGRMGSDTSTRSNPNRSGTGERADTGGRMGASASGSDSAKANQTESGVTDPKTGKSTLGKKVTKTRPDQGPPVTSKGDTLRKGGDTVP